jgi:antitoxin component YwqK of YwqJK toxin-antitoxin module
MKKLSLTLLTCLMFLSHNMVMSETMGDLVKHEGIWFKKFTKVPFTGKVAGQFQGTIQNGKMEGAWVGYREGGQLMSKGNYKNGVLEGSWVDYRKDGQLWEIGNFKNGKKGGSWVSYNEDGTVDKKNTGTYKNGKKISD